MKEKKFIASADSFSQRLWQWYCRRDSSGLKGPRNDALRRKAIAGGGARATRMCYTSDIENAVGNGGILQLQQGQGHVVDGNASGGFAFHAAMVSVAVQDEVGAVAVSHLGQARGAEVGINFGGFALHGGADRGIVDHHNALFGA